MKRYFAIIERDLATGLYVGYVPDLRGAHTQGASLDDVNANLREVIELLLEDGEPVEESTFIGIHQIEVP
jgi:predicted RNase H-like HicB family nuclease